MANQGQICKSTGLVEQSLRPLTSFLSLTSCCLCIWFLLESQGSEVWQIWGDTQTLRDSKALQNAVASEQD